MQPFVLNARGRVVFPSNFLPQLDFSVIQDEEQLSRVIRRDFESKAPTGTDILERIQRGRYADRHALMRDMALNLFWAYRYALTMYDKRPTRWRDVPRHRDDVYLPTFRAWQDGDAKVAAVEQAYAALPPAWDADAEDRIFTLLFGVFRHRRHHATEMPAGKPTVAEALADPRNQTWRLPTYDPDHPRFGLQAIIDCGEEVAELEALHRWAMVLHDDQPWDLSQTELVEVGALRDDDVVVLFHPRDREVARFLQTARRAERVTPVPRSAPEARPPVRPYPALEVRARFAVQPRLESLAVVKGEQVCTNDDLIRNSAYSWSPMTADDIRDKTGIEQRLYTSRSLEEISLEASRQALVHAGRAPEEIGAVLFCTCTSTRLIPSVATWISGELGMQQTHASCDVIAACAGFPYGLSEATRLLQEVERPVLVVCAEKFSDKIGTVRPSRMIFGDGAAAFVVGPAPEGEDGDVDYLNTYASGPASEVNSILWPNPVFDNSLTVQGPEVKSLAGRYLAQMMDELRALPHPDGPAGSLLDSIDLVVPHQANKTMIGKLADNAGLAADRLYFNIADVGNVSAASIPLAIYDAVREGVIDRPLRIFAPGFGAGAVGGYAVLRIDPRIVALGRTSAAEHRAVGAGVEDGSATTTGLEDVRIAFGD
ncbi:MAG: 3-oxoacyl-[acyl-carrier-protein] synthase III C-terminal domain-containing protein [Mycobacteriales bacterium]